jgi:hypothetical protein
MDTRKRILDLLEIISKELETSKELNGNEGEKVPRKIGTTRKVSISLPEEDWAKIDQKTAISGSISSVMREIIQNYLEIEKMVK